MTQRESRGAPLALLDLPLALLAAALWYARPELGPWPLLLVALGLVTRLLARPRPRLAPSGLDAAVILFGLSAALGLALAYNRDVALEKFWAIVGGIAIYGALCRAPQEARVAGYGVRPIPALLAVLPPFIALYYLVSADYGLVIGKLPLFDPVYRALQAARPALPLDGLHSNVAGGVIAALLPLQVVAVRGRRAGYALVAVSLAGLLLSESRGAWLALLAVAAASGLIWLARAGRPRAAVAAAVAAVLLVAAVAIPGLLGRAGAAPQAAAPVSAAAANAAAANAAGEAEGPTTLPEIAGDNPKLFTGLAGRLTLFGHAATLARDYAFTGLGLGGFPMAFSSYVLLVHVGHTMHSHNLWLDVWLETGLPGLVALIWLFVAGITAAWRIFRFGMGPGRAWAGAALAALAVLGLHGLLDDALFGSRGALFMFIPFAILAREQAAALAQADELRPTLAENLRGRGGLTAAVVLATLLAASLLPPVRSQLQANLAALYQTRAELTIYDWPAWPIQDELRRVPAYNVEPALARYRAALTLDAGNETANRRLGQIMLSRGDYDTAGPLLAAAYRAGYTNRAAKQLYGEWLAINDRPQEAAAIWRTIDLNQGQLDARAWWYGRVGEREKADAIRRAARLR